MARPAIGAAGSVPIECADICADINRLFQDECLDSFVEIIGMNLDEKAQTKSPLGRKIIILDEFQV